MTELPFLRGRPEATVATPLTLAELREFDAILDARSPAEFAEDHLPGAINELNRFASEPLNKSVVAPLAYNVRGNSSIVDWYGREQHNHGCGIFRIP